MADLFLFHNSEELYETLSPSDPKRPLFYWYSDRFCSHVWPQKYLYIFVINPKEQKIELRSRTDDKGFNELHKAFLDYKNFCEGNTPDINYAEAGIAMSFNIMRPTMILKAVDYMQGENLRDICYKIIFPEKLVNKQSITLFDNTDNPIPFIDIPEMTQSIPNLNTCLPFCCINPRHNKEYVYEDWLAMETENNGVWL